MLMRGINVDALSILTGCDRDQLQPYVRRSQQKAALEEAIRLDRHHGSKVDSPGG
jgi:hypothetical protein